MVRFQIVVYVPDTCLRSHATCTCVCTPIHAGVALPLLLRADLFALGSDAPHWQGCRTLTPTSATNSAIPHLVYFLFLQDYARDAVCKNRKHDHYAIRNISLAPWCQELALPNVEKEPACVHQRRQQTRGVPCPQFVVGYALYIAGRGSASVNVDGPKTCTQDMVMSWGTRTMSWGTCTQDMCAPRHGKMGKCTPRYQPKTW